MKSQASVPMVDAAQGAEFLARLHASTQGNIELRALPSKDRIFTRDAGELSAFISKHAREGVFYGLATRDASGLGKKENCVEVPALWADIDFHGDAPDPLTYVEGHWWQEPSVMVSSGAGVHVLHLFDSPLSAQDPRLEPALKSLAAHYGADMAAAETARLLRVPGTLNTKYSPARQARIIWRDWGATCSFKDITGLCGPPAADNSSGKATEGQRHTFMVRQAGRLWRLGWVSPAELEQVLLALNQACCVPSLPADEVRRIGRDIARKPRAESEADPAQWRALFKSPSQMDASEPRFLIGNFLPEGVTFLGSLAGEGKTWLALSMARALTRGTNFLGLPCFRVPEAVPVLYLVPEMGERAFHRRMAKMGIPEENFLCRTMQQGLPIALNNPALLAAVAELRPVIFLDTAVRFSAAETENSATENSQGLALGIFALLRAGARAIVGLHHRPKNAAGKALTLENVLRGTGDVGAMCDCVWGLRCEDKQTMELRLECVKARDFEPVGAFRIQGRPMIDEVRDFGVLESPKSPRGEAEIAALGKAIEANPLATYRELAALTDIAEGRIAKVAAKAGWRKEGREWRKHLDCSSFHPLGVVKDEQELFSR